MLLASGIYSSLWLYKLLSVTAFYWFYLPQLYYYRIIIIHNNTTLFNTTPITALIGFIVEKRPSYGGDFQEVASYKEVAQLVSKGSAGGRWVSDLILFVVVAIIITNLAKFA